MKIFYDCEFLEDGRTIELISLGMLREDGKEYYAVNAAMPWFKIQQHDWLMINVVPHLPTRMSASGVRGLNFDNVNVKSDLVIADEVRRFIQTAGPDVELWAWYGAYDHVALCQLWGRMIDLPPGVPMFTHNIRQEFQRLGNPRGPAQDSTEHHALADAKHNKTMYEFIKQVERDRFRDALKDEVKDFLGG